MGTPGRAQHPHRESVTTMPELLTTILTGVAVALLEALVVHVTKSALARRAAAA